MDHRNLKSFLAVDCASSLSREGLHVVYLSNIQLFQLTLSDFKALSLRDKTES